MLSTQSPQIYHAHAHVYDEFHLRSLPCTLIRARFAGKDRRGAIHRTDEIVGTGKEDQHHLGQKVLICWYRGSDGRCAPSEPARLRRRSTLLAAKESARQYRPSPRTSSRSTSSLASKLALSCNGAPQREPLREVQTLICQQTAKSLFTPISYPNTEFLVSRRTSPLASQLF